MFDCHFDQGERVVGCGWKRGSSEFSTFPSLSFLFFKKHKSGSDCFHFDTGLITYQDGLKLTQLRPDLTGLWFSFLFSFPGSLMWHFWLFNHPLSHRQIITNILWSFLAGGGCFGVATPGGVQGCSLFPCSEITLGGDWETMCGLRDLNQRRWDVRQVPHHLYCLSSPRAHH